jgi:hypothetical protein
MSHPHSSDFPTYRIFDVLRTVGTMIRPRNRGLVLVPAEVASIIAAGGDLDDALDVAVLVGMAAFWHDTLGEGLCLLLARLLEFFLDLDFGLLATGFEHVGLVVVD